MRKLKIAIVTKGNSAYTNRSYRMNFLLYVVGYAIALFMIFFVTLFMILSKTLFMMPFKTLLTVLFTTLFCKASECYRAIVNSQRHSFAIVVVRRTYSPTPCFVIFFIKYAFKITFETYIYIL